MTAASRRANDGLAEMNGQAADHEAMPLYRYQLHLRLARALDLLGQYDDLTALGLDLGFSSHSHFSSAFRQAYGRTPAEFQRSARLR